MASSSSSPSITTRRTGSLMPSLGSVSSFIVLSSVFLAVPTSAFRSTRGTASTFRLSSLDASTIMAPADLTPAIDKFVRLPTGPNLDPYFMTAAGAAPPGPEPFAMVSNELQPLSDYVREMVVSENPVLTMAASHFFEKVRAMPAFR